MNEKKLAEKLKNRRVQKGFSQELLAENSGISLRTIQRIENGESIPRGDTLIRIANSLDVSVSEFLDQNLTEDNTFLLNLNSSVLTFLLFPVLGIIVPLILWISKKDQIHRARETGIEILNFQITWNIILFLTLPLAYFLSIYHINNKIMEAGDISPAIVNSAFRSTLFIILGAITILYVFNLILIVVNLNRIKKGKRTRYSPQFRFLR